VSGRKISFDGWVLDRESGDLTRNGTRQRLQELPLKVLDLLLANPGGVVTREQLISHLWPNGVVEFDTGLNTAIRKLRVALGDVADTPRYIETLPRRGYRFLGAIDPPSPPDVAPRTTQPSQAAEPGNATSAAETSVRPQGRRLIPIAAALLVATALAAGVFYGWSHRTPEPVALPARAAATLILPDHTVAVLPFENLSPESNNEFLALGIAETVLHQLASLQDLTVIARTSSFVFRNRNEDAREIGRKLNARFLVEGSVQRAGERLRVTAELIDATSGARRWSLSFDRQLVDIFALQDEISTKVADALSVSLQGDYGRDPEVRTSKVDAYLAYMQGRALINTFKVADAEAAIGHFARATEIDPQFAAAYAQESRAVTHLLQVRESEDPAAIARATALNDKALTLEPSLGEAWVQRATMRNQFNEKNPALIEQEFRKGLALAPNYGEGYSAFAEFLYSQNRVPESLTFIERARQLDPLAPRLHYLKAIFLWNSGGRDEEVQALFMQALKVNPAYAPALARLGQMNNARGEFAQGVKFLERALTLDPQAIWIREAIAVTYLDMGDGAAAEDVLQVQGGRERTIQPCILIFKGEPTAAAEAAYAIFGGMHTEPIPSSEICAAAAIRNEALRTRQYDRAIRELQRQYGLHTGSLDQDQAADISFTWGLAYAEVLLAKGERARGMQLARAVLAAIDGVASHPSMKVESSYWRALTLAVLGDRDQALESLQSAVHGGFHLRWWMLENQPALAGLRNDPRYQAVVAELKEWARAQAVLLAELRKTHEVPERPARPAHD
jgi:TolB-like protein/DNA-binding winged helix-turn-helix (wHTH) protein/tetratricopeptide (TPR) repeat protein